MLSRSLGIGTLVHLVGYAPTITEAASAFGLVAGPHWLGIDGSWSTFDFQIGSSNPQTVSLTVSTTAGEIWLVENTGCSESYLCTAARGNVYDIHKSTSWKSLGSYELGVDARAMGGIGDYGTESLMLNNRVTQRTVTMDSVLMAGINATQYYVGYVGMSATPTSLAGKDIIPLLSQLAETTGDIPSHSYGYTAGASYIGSLAGVPGTPASLTLGGYDANRLVPHDVMFNLDPNVRTPQVLLRGIIASVSSANQAPTNWTSSTRILSGMNDSQVAYIDTTTPYLWLPEAICDRFSDALGLVWNDTLNLYLFRNDQQYNDFLKQKTLSFTFALSSFDNTNDFGQPFDTPGVVNITVTAAAFALSVSYPFPGIKFRDQAIPYFPLMRAPANHAIVIGRAFMQEAYIVTKYEENTFSLHQAKFPEDGRSNTNIKDIARPPNSGFPAYNGPSPGGLSIGATAGIVIAAFVTGSVFGLTFWLCRRRKKRSEKLPLDKGDDDLKDTGSSVDTEPPASPIERIFSFIIRRKKSRKPAAHEIAGSSSQPVEAPNHELYELPVPLEPVELDSSTHDGTFGDDTTELGTEGSQGVSEYEIARRKLQKQLQGPVPTYSPPRTAEVALTDEKTDQDVSPVAHYRPADDTSPVSSPTYGNSDSFPNTLPSPMTPRGDWTNRFDLPSPMTVAPPVPPFPPAHLPTRSNSDPSTLDSPQSPLSPLSLNSPHSPHTYQASSMSRSSSSNGSTAHSPSSLVPPTALYQRTPIDPSRVICLGPLPENVQLSEPQRIAIPPIIEPSGGRGADTSEPSSSGIRISTSHHGERRRSSDTLGSNFTVDEDDRIQEEISRESSRRQQPGDIPRSPNRAERIDAGSELVHVPQLADRRYSWEVDGS